MRDYLPGLKTKQRNGHSSVWVRCGTAVLLTLGALIIEVAVRPKVKLNDFNLFQGAVFLSAWYGGLGPGILASLLSTVAIDYYLVPPLYEFSFAWLDDGINLAVFWGLTLVRSSLSANLRKTKSELQLAHDELEIRIQERTEQLSHANASLADEVAERLETEKAILEISGREQRRMGRNCMTGYVRLWPV